MSEQITEAVRRSYGAVAQQGRSSEQDGTRAVAHAFGYSADELDAIPAAANMGLSCGNPTAVASLKPGETVVDLGSGGGLDVFLAARQVGSTGRAIGIDMTPEMIGLARRNARTAGADGGPLANVAFYLGEIEHLPLADGSVDCVISNCVVNLAPDKPAVFREIARVLKPGGRVAISDIVLTAPLPDAVAADLAAWTGCISGAIPVDAFVGGLIDAGLSAVDARPTGSDLNAYALGGDTGCCTPISSVAPTAERDCCGPDCCSPGVGADLQILAPPTNALDGVDLNAYAASFQFFGVKP